MDRPFERIELGEGDWVEIYTLVTRGMRKLFRNAATAAAIGKIHINGDTDLSDQNAVKRELLANVASFDLNAEDDAYLLHGIKAWSWSDPIRLDVIDLMPSATVAQILERLQALYTEVPEDTQKKDTATSLPPT